MFGIAFTYSEERALLKLLGFVAMSDRQVSEAEREYILDTSHNFDVSAEGILEDDSDESLAEICESFESDSAKRLALVRLIELGYVDGAYEEPEWVGIREVAEVMGIEGLDLVALEDWVSRGMEWKEEGRKLLLPEDHE